MSKAPKIKPVVAWWRRFGALPVYPTRILPGFGLVTERGEPVEIFRRATENEALRAAFDASPFGKIAEFQQHLAGHDAAPRRWRAIGYGMQIEWWAAIVPRSLLRPSAA